MMENPRFITAAPHFPSDALAALAGRRGITLAVSCASVMAHLVQCTISIPKQLRDVQGGPSRRLRLLPAELGVLALQSPPSGFKQDEAIQHFSEAKTNEET
ncbi:hypothetical protein MTBLM5_390010 [Magnetospirillum sp. LM-5]|nr:hypothetical protein MTBLM5_390010 [Magnetospirillum sp. LM-5]